LDRSRKIRARCFAGLRTGGHLGFEAANQRITDAQYNPGELRQHTLPQDYAKAYFWYGSVQERAEVGFKIVPPKQTRNKTASNRAALRETNRVWVGSRFSGDTNGVLMDVQDRLYPDLIGLLYGQPRKRYLDACRLVQSDSDLAKKLEGEKSFDHRTLQSCHDLIAAWFRFLRGAHGQRSLFETEDNYRARLGREWRNFYEKEILSLSEDDDFVRAVLAATVFPNPDTAGCAAEDQLGEFLEKRYAAMKSRAYMQAWDKLVRESKKAGK
jgi:hypothetical protein